jgi:hypothetical protein
MLHLFKRVYLSIDETLDTSNHRIVISQDYGYPMVTDQTNLGTLLNYATSLDAVIGPDAAFANYLGFFNYLDGQCDSLDAQLVVYADKDAFVKLSTNFLRAALPLANAQDIYRILSYYLARQNLLCSSANYYSPVQNVERLKSKTGITQEEVSAEFFANRVNPPDFYAFFASKYKDLSIEYVAATYSYNGRLATEMAEQLRSFAIKHAYMCAIESRQAICDTLLSAHTQSVLNLANLPVQEMINVVKNADSTAIFFDERVFPREESTVSLDANWRKLSTADIVKLSRMSIKVLHEIEKWPIMQDLGYNSMQVLQAIVDINNPQAWQRHADKMLDNLCLVANEAEPHKVNALLVNYITENRGANKDLLRPFVVNGCY